MTIKDEPFALSALNSSTNNYEWRVLIQSGKVKGHSVMDKFGANQEITVGSDPEDICDQGGVYIFTDNAGADYYVSSSNSGDNQLVKFEVLTVDSSDNWNKEVFEQVISGQVKTLLTPPSGDPIVRIYRIENEGASGDDLAGDLYVYEDTTVTLGVPDDLTKIRAKIFAGEINQTLMAIYTIPTGYVGFLTKGEAGMNFEGSVGAGTNFAKMYYKSRRYGKVFKVKKEFSLINVASSNYEDNRCFPDPIPSKTDIKITCEEVSETMGVWAAFCILLIDENQFSDEYLASIGHIKRV